MADSTSTVPLDEVKTNGQSASETAVQHSEPMLAEVDMILPPRTTSILKPSAVGCELKRLVSIWPCIPKAKANEGEKKVARDVTPRRAARESQTLGGIYRPFQSRKGSAYFLVGGFMTKL